MVQIKKKTVGKNYRRKKSTIKQTCKTWLFFFPFKDSFAKDDIALVRLRDPVSFGPYVNKIELNTDDNYPPDGKVCFTQGWGCTSNNGNLCNLSYIYI